MAVQSAADLIVLLLYVQGSTRKVNEEIKGITRMEKLMYLLLKEGGLKNHSLMKSPLSHTTSDRTRLRFTT